VLWTEGHDAGETLAFDTRSGELRARKIGDGWIELDFPATTAVGADIEPEILATLAVTPVRTARTDNGWILVEVATANDVRAAAPDLPRLGATTEDGVIVTAPGDGHGVDIVSRVFVPAAGIPEDPVTGAAHCVLATWWWDRVGKDQIAAEQASERGGRLLLVLAGDRVKLRGQAVTTLRGELAI
jgi:PhzF family phenazine biosynthesis protein